MTRTSSRRDLHRLLSSLLLLSIVASSVSLFAFPRAADATGEITFRSSATSLGQTITGPADIASGDLIVLVDRARNTSGTPSLVTPSGYTNLRNDTFDAFRQTLWYKLADGSEASASLTGMNGTNQNAKVMLVFAGPFASVTPSAFNHEETSGNPSGQSVVASGGTPPLVVLGVYGASGPIAPRSFTPTKDGEVSASDSLDEVWLAYKTYNAAPADTTIDMGDEGSYNILQSGYIEVTTLFDAPASLITTSMTGAVSLSWTAPSNIGGSNLETYAIWRATTPFIATTSATLIASIATTSTSYSDTSVVLRTTYYYRVTATNASATSSLSNQRVSNANSGRIIRLGGVRLR